MCPPLGVAIIIGKVFLAYYFQVQHLTLKNPISSYSLNDLNQVTLAIPFFAGKPFGNIATYEKPTFLKFS